MRGDIAGYLVPNGGIKGSWYPTKFKNSRDKSPSSSTTYPKKTLLPPLVSILASKPPRPRHPLTPIALDPHPLNSPILSPLAPLGTPTCSIRTRPPIRIRPVRIREWRGQRLIIITRAVLYGGERSTIPIHPRSRGGGRSVGMSGIVDIQPVDSERATEIHVRSGCRVQPACSSAHRGDGIDRSSSRRSRLPNRKSIMSRDLLSCGAR